MTRRADAFQTIHSEGGLLPPDLLRRLLEPKEKLPGTQPADYGLAPGERLNEVLTQSWNRLRRHWAAFREAAKHLAAGQPGDTLTNDRWNLPLLRELGERWVQGLGSVAEEHFFSMFLRNELGARFHHLNRDRRGPRLLAACLPGEHHEVGLLLFTLAALDRDVDQILEKRRWLLSRGAPPSSANEGSAR